MTIVFWTNAISTTGTLLTSFYIFGKALRHNPSAMQISLAALWSFLWALLFSADPFGIPLFMNRIIYCTVTIVLIWMILKVKTDTMISSYLLSFGVSNFLFYIVGLPISFFFALFLSSGFPGDTLVDFNEPLYLISYVLSASLQFLLAYLFFKIRRFKNGFPFIFEKYTIIIVLIATGIILTIVSLFTTPRDSYDNIYIFSSLIVGVIIVGMGIYIFIRRSIEMWKRKRVAENNEKILEQQVEQLEQQLEKSCAVNENLREANHSLNHRLNSIERGVVRMLERHKQTFSSEISEDFSITIADIHRLSGEHIADVGRVKHDSVLPSANVKTIDDMFKMFAEQFSAADIKFKLSVTGSIIYMTENTIALGLLETMIGDLLQNALIAVNKSEMSFRNIMAAIGEVGDYYEFSVHDSGIPFDVDTLTRLGTERVTTHADEGGSGVGFMKTFKTMRECRASLIITEKEPGSGFSKIVTIRFDNENKYIIETYRPDEFPPSDRYSVVSAK